MKTHITALFLLLLSFRVHANETHPPSLPCFFYETFIVMDMDTWKAEMYKLSEVYSRTQNTAILRELLKAQYGYLGYLMGEREGETPLIKSLLDDFDKNINALFALKQDSALAYSYLASYYAYRIVVYPTTALVNGRRTINAIERSVALDPDSYQIWSNRAIIETNIPELMGADYRKAITFYDKSLNLIRQEQRETCNWVLLNTLLWKAKCYEKLNEPTLAIQTYNEILHIAPHFDSVERWRDRLAQAQTNTM